MVDKTICFKCPTQGICCLYETRIHGKRLVSDFYCRYLNLETRKCKVFTNRFKKNPECLTIKEMIDGGHVPPWCLHVKDNIDYQKREDRRLYSFIITPVVDTEGAIAGKMMDDEEVKPDEPS